MYKNKPKFKYLDAFEKGERQVASGEGEFWTIMTIVIILTIATIASFAFIGWVIVMVMKYFGIL